LDWNVHEESLAILTTQIIIWERRKVEIRFYKDPSL
jgi:hypothetical protein